MCPYCESIEVSRVVYNKTTAIRMLEKLKEYNRDLEVFVDISLSEYKINRISKYAIERIVFLITENVLDILEHYLSGKYKILSDTYEEIIENSFSNKVISQDLYNSLKGIGKFRNVLAHEYLELDDELIFNGFKRITSFLPEFVSEVEALIEF